MESEQLQVAVAASTQTVMIEPELVRQIRALEAMRWGGKRIARELGVVTQLLAEQGVDVDVRVVQRVLQPHRQTKRAAEAATVCFETEPSHQVQIDFGEKHVMIAGQRTRVMLFLPLERPRLLPARHAALRARQHLGDDESAGDRVGPRLRRRH